MVVPSWRRPAQLRRCLAALEAQERRASEVIVVVRGDDDETRAVAAEAGASEIAVEAPGVVAALEAGRLAARGDVVAFTDDDAVPDADWLARIADHFERDPRLGAVGGRDRLEGNVDPPLPGERIGRVRWYGRRVGEHHRGVGSAVPADVLKGVNIALRRSAIEEVGFDPRLRGGGAQRHWELALCLGVKRAGWELVYDPAVAVDHHEGERFGSSQRGFPELSELRDAAHNELYAMLRWLPLWRTPIALLYGLLVGSRELPGLVAALERGVRSGRWKHVLERLRAATDGRLRAIATAYEARRQSSSQSFSSRMTS